MRGKITSDYGHWGEMPLFYRDRVDQVFGAVKFSANRRNLLQINVLVAPTGILDQHNARSKKVRG